MRLRGVASLVNWSLPPFFIQTIGRLVSIAVGDIARARGMMQLARDTGITREGLYKALGEQGNPSFATVVKVMDALGLQFNLGARTVKD